MLSKMERICRWLSRLYSALITRTLYYYFCCTISTVIVSGLVFSYGFVETAVVQILVDYISYQLGGTDIRIYAAIVNLMDGLCSVLIIVVAFLADTCIGRFRMILLCTAAYIFGLVLLFFPPNHSAGRLCVAVMLIGIGQAGRKPSLKAFLADQLKKRVQCLSRAEQQVEDCIRHWWLFFRFWGAAAAYLVAGISDSRPIRDSWSIRLKVSASVMGVTFILLLLGIHHYHYEPPTGSSLSLWLIDIFRKVKDVMFNKHLPHPPTHDCEIAENDREENTPARESPLNRCLDKAALKESATSQNEQETKENVVTDTEVKKRKGIIRLIPMLPVFMAYCVVEATGNTFFFVQSTNLDPTVGRFKVPLSTFYLIQILAGYTITSFCEYGVRKWWSDHQVSVMKVRIVLGMGCSFLCCGTAWLVEVCRLGLVKTELVDQYTPINMSICWLMPQFFLLGLMQGLTEDGLADFFYDLLPASMRAYGPSFNQTVIGIGKLIIATLLFSFKSWFGSDNINNSHLDSFYGILAIALCLVSLAFNISLYFLVYPDIKGVEQSLDGRLEDRVTTVLTSF